MANQLDQRVLVLMPSDKDAQRTGQLLVGAAIDYSVCKDIVELCHEIEHGAALALLTEEAIELDRKHCLAAALGKQPPWSDFPLIVIAKEYPTSRIFPPSMNTTLIERPVRMRSLMSVIHAELRARRHQYDVRNHLLERERLENELRLANRKKDDFIAILAHELRNPLAPLRNGLQILQLAPEDTSATAKAREMMERQLAHMVRLIDDLLDVSRITRNKLELRKKRILLTDALSAAIETARPAIDAARQSLSVSLPPYPVYLDADLTRLAQVFANLLTNSAKYSSFGGRISIFAERQGSEVVVSVTDTGVGIPAESLERIFGMFSQVERSGEQAQGGLGIGLALVRGLVEAHRGTVRAESEGVGQGARFMVTLPIAQKESESMPLEAKNRRIIRSMTRILVADDNMDSAESLCTMLRLMGHDVHVAHDGIEAIELAERLRPQLIFMDIGMPRLSGLEATKAIRQYPWGQEVVIIALTGWGQERDRRRSQQAGCDDHLVKPLDRLQLDRVLEQFSLRPIRESYESLGRADRN